jgi:predicted ATPase
MAAGGTVFKHTGDGLLATLPSVVAAVQAAVSGQRAIAAEDWGEPEELQVRMAIHAGDAEARDADWFGPALNRGARLLGLAHGGQVLISSAAYGLMIDAPPSEADLADLGSHRLRDLSGLERVWQVRAPGLRASFPALRSLDGALGNLPAALTSFVGRQAELAELRELLGGHRLVTIVGPGGMGKTRVALESADAAKASFLGGVWLVELASVEQSDAVDHAVAAALEIDATSGISSRELIAKSLPNQRSLLLLDNCEHVVDAAAHLVGELLRRCPELVVLATSRQALDLTAEHVLPLGALLPDDQMALFHQRARSSRSGFDADPIVLTDVCEQLDGMPLAIELAAARLRSMTLVELQAGLRQRFRLLTASRDAPSRHQSLERVVAWSVDQLDHDERQLFERLAVFLGEFDLPAVHAVCAEPSSDSFETLVLLDRLVEKSLLLPVERADHTRYRLLETLRQYGEGRLAPHILGELRNRHAEYYVQRIPALERAADSGGLTLPELVDDDFANIRAAFRHAAAIGDHDRRLTMISNLNRYAEMRPTLEVAEWADEALAQADSRPARLVVRAHLAASSARHYLADFPAAERHARAAIATDEASGHPPRAIALLRLIPPLAYMGRAHEAAELGVRALALARQDGRSRLVANVHGYTFWARAYAGLLPRLLDADEVWELSQGRHEAIVRTAALSVYGIDAYMRRDPAAIPALNAWVVAADESGHLHSRCLSRTYLALAEGAQDPTLALRGLRVALVEYGAARLPFGPKGHAHDFVPSMAALKSWSTIAMLDGAAPGASIFPAEVRAAKAAAREALGENTYDRFVRRATGLTHAEYEAFLHTELDALGVPDVGAEVD